MKAFWRNTLLVAGAFAVGGIGGTLYDDGPASVPTPRVPVEHWSLPAGPDAGLAKADAAWKKQSPWGVVATSPVVAAPPPLPPLVPVGLFRTRRSYQAIFIRPGTGEEVHVGPGQSLPGGGRFLSAYRMQVRWIDSDGRRQTRKLMFDPLVQAAAQSAQAAVSPGLQPSVSMQPRTTPSASRPGVTQPSGYKLPPSLKLPPGVKPPPGR